MFKVNNKNMISDDFRVYRSGTFVENSPGMYLILLFYYFFVLKEHRSGTLVENGLIIIKHQSHFWQQNTNHVKHFIELFNVNMPQKNPNLYQPDIMLPLLL